MNDNPLHFCWWAISMTTVNHPICDTSRAMWFRLPLFALLAALTFSVSGGILVGQDDQPRTAAKRDAQLNTMKEIVESFSVYWGEGSLKRPLKLRGEPLLRWNDPIRRNSDASMWAWGEAGWPLAVLSLEIVEDKGADHLSWGLEFISFVPESLNSRGEYAINATLPNTNKLLNGTLSWAPEKPGVTFTARYRTPRRPHRLLDCGSPRCGTSSSDSPPRSTLPNSPTCSG